MTSHPRARTSVRTGVPDEIEEWPPTMSRARAQLASAYAPERLFTWEGGRGICKATSINGKENELHHPTRQMIFEGIRESAKTWLERALPAVPAGASTHLELILDRRLYDARTQQVQVDDVRHFSFPRPDRIGYVPFPLLYRCGVCGRLKEFKSVGQQARVGLPKTCGDHSARWSQVDVVYVHWSGGLAPLSPYRHHLDPKTGNVERIESCECGTREFRLDNQAPSFAAWSFVCMGCGRSRDLRQPDPHTLQVLKPAMDAGDANQWLEVNMLPVSYRANAAYYPQRNYFIELPEHSDVVDILSPDRQSDLGRELARIHGLSLSALDPEALKAAIQSGPAPSEWDDYEMYLDIAAKFEARGNTVEARRQQANARRLHDGWISAGLIPAGGLSNPALLHALDERRDWAQRYDPIRLTVEHAAFLEEHVDAKLASRRAVDLTDPDPDLNPAAGNPQATLSHREEVRALLKRLGLARMVLIRGLPVCEYSFGYTRVSADPVHIRHHAGVDHKVPVRLNLFPAMDEGKHPIYALQQNNEALYLRLDPTRVARWLAANLPEAPDPDRLALAYLEQYVDFGPFLRDYRGHEGDGPSRTLPAMIYFLLHSLAHQIVHAIADLSGLERSAIGEHIYPADLAIVLYRKGMTPDLGNISAMWRNHGLDVLKRLLEPRQLRCGSGSLCDHRGGACPACIMIPDISCLAGNQLLSRAALRGGPPAGWEPRKSPPYVGYFDPCLFESEGGAP